MKQIDLTFGDLWQILHDMSLASKVEGKQMMSPFCNKETRARLEKLHSNRMVIINKLGLNGYDLHCFHDDPTMGSLLRLREIAQQDDHDTQNSPS